MTSTTTATAEPASAATAATAPAATTAAPAPAPAMEYRYLGATGLRVSALCLGTMTFGASTWGLPTCDEATAHAMLDRFVAAGGNFLDTADIYGESEEVIGRWLAGKGEGFRERLVIATKVRFETDRSDPNASGLSRKHVAAAVRRSLRRLQIDYIDLLQVHGWDVSVGVEEQMRVFADVIRGGKVHYIGTSNWTAWQIQKANDYARAHGLEPFVCHQPQYHLLSRGIEWEVLPMCAAERMANIIWSPLAGGWLSGKHRRDAGKPEEGSRVDWAERVGWAATGWSTRNSEHTWAVLDVVAAVAAEAGRSMAQVALRWLLQRPGVTCVIIGAKTLAQLDDNIAAVGWQLSPDHMLRLDAASHVPPPHPYDSWSLVARDQPKKS